MNPDARDAAARHLLGLLPPEDESLLHAAAAGDPALQAACQEIEGLAALIAVASNPPAVPSPETWQRVRAACGLAAPSRGHHRWLLWSGGGVAAALAVLMSISSDRFSRTSPGSPAGQAGGGGSLPAHPERQTSPVRPGPPDSATAIFRGGPGRRGDKIGLVELRLGCVQYVAEFPNLPLSQVPDLTSEFGKFRRLKSAAFVLCHL